MDLKHNELLILRIFFIKRLNLGPCIDNVNAPEYSKIYNICLLQLH